MFPRRSKLCSTLTMDAPAPKTFTLAGREFPRVTWWREPGMRSLYIWLLFAVLTSATNGFDGSMMNGLQSLTQWKTCKFPNKDGNP